jgi:hypothetical protein
VPEAVDAFREEACTANFCVKKYCSLDEASFTGFPDLAIAELKAAVSFDPVSADVSAALAKAMQGGASADAVAVVKRWVGRLDASLANALEWLAAAMARSQGGCPAARSALDRARALAANAGPLEDASPAPDDVDRRCPMPDAGARGSVDDRDAGGSSVR